MQLLAELYRDVTRNQDRLPLGNLTRHTLKRLGQSYTALTVIEAARRADRISAVTTVRPTRAMVQDKRTSQEFPAAHTLPCDLEFATPSGARRLPEFFTTALNRGWIERNVFAPTDRVHRLANLADRWIEDAGAKRALAEAAAQVIEGRSAAAAFHEVVEPGYVRAIDQALGKVERNLTYFERQAIFRSRIVQHDGTPARPAPAPDDLLLKAHHLDARASTATRGSWIGRRPLRRHGSRLRPDHDPRESPR